ncbi:MAG: hypothetical protein GXY57_03495 [Erysipelotrichaceae bacterium]|nr:hypothetical protein [Erysipelotrichaceae bacterium]
MKKLFKLIPLALMMTVALTACDFDIFTIHVDEIQLSDNEIQLVVDQTYQMTAYVYPADATNKGITWTSSDESVAVSSSGLLTAVSEGEATITATAKDISGVSATAEITVIEGVGLQKTELAYTYSDYIENNVYSLDNAPSIGTAKLLVVPVWFNDSSTYITSESRKANVHSDIERAYFGTPEETGWHSVKSFYEEQSKGALTVEGTVTDWYEVGQNSSYFYTKYDGGDRTSSLVTTVVNWFFNNNPSESKSDYDRDDNGHLDGVMLIYGSPDSQVMPSAGDNMWAYCYWLQGSPGSVNNPTPNVYFWASYDFMYSESTALSRAGSFYGNGDTSHATVDSHTFIHEMGHVFGLDDYYDYSDNQYSPAGGFSMQDYNVGGHDPYSIMALGWADPYIPNNSMTITIGDFQSSHDVVLLTPSWNTIDSPFDEYLLLELYAPTGLNQMDATYQYSGGYPKGPTDPGIRVWHVDARLTRYVYGSYSSNFVNNPTAGNVYHAMSNTYYSSPEDLDYISPLGQTYANYNLLQLIRNNTSVGYTPTTNLSSNDLFEQGDTFNMDTYKKQFVEQGKLNSDTNLGWSFTVNSLSSSSATITVSRQAA